mgnify:FL=1|tara:strand:- start:1355 stop:1594 length:240 start_codon:yes stop_codon:yes gene_type:complete
MFCVGDLIRIPSNVRMTKQGEQLKVITDYKMTKKPELGIFISYTNQGDCVVSSEGEKWLVRPDVIRIAEASFDKISANS